MNTTPPTPSESTAAGGPDTLILFAHGARDPQWRGPVDAMARLLRETVPGARVDVAFLEFMSPTLVEAIDAAAAAGSRRVSVAPVFWAEGGHLKREVPELLHEASTRHPSLVIDRWPVLGESPEVLQALAGVYRTRWGQRSA